MLQRRGGWQQWHKKGRGRWRDNNCGSDSDSCDSTITKEEEEEEGGGGEEENNKCKYN